MEKYEVTVLNVGGLEQSLQKAKELESNYNEKKMTTKRASLSENITQEAFDDYIFKSIDIGLTSYFDIILPLPNHLNIDNIMKGEYKNIIRFTEI